MLFGHQLSSQLRPEEGQDGLPLQPGSQILGNDPCLSQPCNLLLQPLGGGAGIETDILHHRVHGDAVIRSAAGIAVTEPPPDPSGGLDCSIFPDLLVLVPAL